MFGKMIRVVPVPKLYFAFTVLLILTLSSTAIAACPCSHHGTSKYARSEPLSCHGSTHEEPRTQSESEASTGDAAGVVCECIVRTVAPAVTAKKESKRFGPQNAQPIGKVEIEPIEILLATLSEADEIAVAVTFYAPIFHRSKPARAPPRL